MKVWNVLPRVSEDLLTQFLFNRGIKTPEEIEKYFNPKLDDYEKDLDILNIKKAQKRINKAIEKEEQIIVYGDYDVDGISASAILYKALSSLGAKVLPYIPHREKEGYGLSKTGLEYARDIGASLVITVDNGIVAIEQAKYAKELGLELIITDHHVPLDEKPEAYTIVHSTQICGAAVAWCLIKDMVKKEEAASLLQFAAIATVCDMMPLLGVNRALVREGLKILNRTDNIGLKALIVDSGLVPGQIGSYEIGHMIGPRLNAIGRLEHAIDALRLLCTKDPDKARRLSKVLNTSNTQRQKMTIESFEQAKEQIGANGKEKIHVLSSKNWHPGIIGLIAARVCEEYYRPAIAMSDGGEFAKGSARSIKGIHITDVIRSSCADILVAVGGHSGAAGFTIESKYIPQFTKKLKEALKSLEIGDRVLDIEAQVESKLLSKKLVKEMDRMEPFGLANTKPVLATMNMAVTDVRTLSEGKHLKFKADGIDCIAFGMGQMAAVLRNGVFANIAYIPDINKYNGTETLQLKVKDIQMV